MLEVRCDRWEVENRNSHFSPPNSYFKNYIKGEIKIFNKLLDLIYPPVCGICGKLSENYLCIKCRNKLFNEAVFGQDYYKDKNFENHFYLFKYEGIIREKLLDYKFNEKPYLFRTFFNFFIFYEKNYFHFNFYDIIIPVPISKKRINNRGYNQSKLIAIEFAKFLDIKLENDILIKNINNKPQSTLDYER